MVLVCLDAELMMMLCEYDHDITCLYKYPFLAGLWNYSLEVWVHLAGREDRAAVSWHSYPRLVHRKPPHLKEDWKLVLWFNTRTAGSSHLVTWNCKVIVKRSFEISSDMLWGYACCCLSALEKGHLLNVFSILLSPSITSSLTVFFFSFLEEIVQK